MTDSNTSDPVPLIWLDVETTGLREDEGHKLLQIAAFGTDGFDTLLVPSNVAVAFNGYLRLDTGSNEFVHAHSSLSNPYVQNMHLKSGVWATVSENSNFGKIDDRFRTSYDSHNSVKGQAGTDEALVEWIDDTFGKEVMPDIGGASITLDRNFIRKYLPLTFERLGYRSLDTSSVRNWLRAARVRIDEFKDSSADHNGLDDSIFTLILAANMADQILGGERVKSLIQQMQATGLPTAAVIEKFGIIL